MLNGNWMPKSSSQLYHINKNVFAFFMFYWFPIHHRAISSILPCHLEDLQIVLQGWKADRMGLKKTTKCVTRSGFRRLPHFNHSFSECYRKESWGNPSRGNRLQVSDFCCCPSSSLNKTKKMSLLKFHVTVTTPGFTWTWLFSNLEITNVFFLWQCFS